MYALETKSGDLEWRFERHDAIYSSPRAVDGSGFVGQNSGIAYALDTDRGIGD